MNYNTNIQSRRTSSQPPITPDLHSPSNFKIPEYLLLTKEKRKQLAETPTVTVKSFVDIINTTAATNRRKILYQNSVVDEYGNTLLHLAVANMDLDFICVLLLKGADPNIKNYGGITAIQLGYLMNLPTKYLHILKRHSHTPFNTSETIAGNIAPEDPPTSEEEEFVKKSIFKYDFPRYFVPDEPTNMAFLDTLPLNSNNQADINSQDGYGCTPLIKAAYKNHHQLVKRLLQAGANVAKEDQRGFNALIWACLGGSVESLQLIRDKFDTVKSYGGMTPLIAAVTGGSLKCVDMIVEKGSNIEAKWKGYDAFQIAVFSAQMDIAVYLKGKFPMIPELNFALEGGIGKMLMLSEFGSKAPKNLVNYPKVMPNGNQASIYATQFFERISPQSFAAIKEDKATLEPFFMSYGARLMMNAMTKLKNKPPDDILKQIVPESEYRNDLISYFKVQGSQLDVLLMIFVKDIITLIDAVAANNKAQYVLIASKAVQNGNEILRIIEAYMNSPAPTPGQKNPPPSAASSIFNSSKMFLRIREGCKYLKNEDIKSLLLATRLAVGAWPPPDAIPNMIKLAIKLSQGFQKLVQLTNATGYWPIGQIDLKQFLPSSGDQPQINSTPISPVSPLSFSEYQRQHESKILNQIATATNSSPTTQAPTPTRTNPADENFFASLDNLVKLFVQSVQTLKQAHADSLKTSYASAASAIYARIDSMFEEIRNYYIFKSMEDNFSVDETITYKKKMSKYRELLFAAADNVILKSKLAAGVWPPPEAAAEMLKGTVPCVVGVKECVEYVKKAVKLIRNTENAERQKMEAFMQEWEQSAKVRNAFTQWEQLQKFAIKDDDEGKPAILPGGDLTPEMVKLLDDGVEGLVLETKDGKEVIKGGRLTKLVEKLADHNYAEPEYRIAFLLTYPSFTNALELLDLLMKRYDISPPYGLDQRLFEVYVNRKIIPVRLRVYNVLKLWMSKYTEDFTKNRQLTEKCLQFVETKMSADFGDITNVLLQTLKRNLQGTTGNIPIIDPSKVPPKSILPKGIGIDELKSFLSYHERAFIDIDPVEFARQLTIIDSSTFKDIRPKECLDQGWEKANKQERSPNICRMIKNTNDLTMWVASSIVKCDDLKARVNLIRYFVNVANACRDLNNFNAITAFVAGMTMGPVFRMTKTWTMFREKWPKVNDLYLDLSDVVSAKGQYAQYRSTLKQTSPPLVPFLGVFLTDLTFVELGNLDYIPELNFINFDKRRKVASIVNDITQYQQDYYSLTTIGPLKEFIMHLGDQGWMDEKAMYAKSLESEPREESDDEDD